MLAQIGSLGVNGIQGYCIQVEVDLAFKLPHFVIVGLPDLAVREARDRVKTAIGNAGYQFPYHHILINLAPADLKKQGPYYDLPIALGLLAASGQIPVDKLGASIAAVGELALDGSVRPVRGVLSMVQAATGQGVRRLLIPHANRHEAAAASDGVEVYPVQSLEQAVRFFTNEEAQEPFQVETEPVANNPEVELDYLEVRGQEHAKRALVIAAAGEHHCLMVGVPGSGKSMLATRLAGILPPLTRQAALETSQVYSIAGLLPPGQGLLQHPPFRAPHHTISDAGLAGGGSFPRPGELSLAHHGVLFLDELPEFHRRTLEVLRQPLESGRITIARARETVTFPSSFLLVAAMNPCPCGYLGESRCSCSDFLVQQYRRRLSGPLLDRFDLHLEIPRVQYDELLAGREGTASATMRSQVLAARQRQRERFAQATTSTNGRISLRLLESCSALNRPSQDLLRKAMTNTGLSARAYHKILRLARTIADLAGQPAIEPEHVAEAIQYRCLDRARAM